MRIRWAKAFLALLPLRKHQSITSRGGTHMPAMWHSYTCMPMQMGIASAHAHSPCGRSAGTSTAHLQLCKGVRSYISNLKTPGTICGPHGNGFSKLIQSSRVPVSKGCRIALMTISPGLHTADLPKGSPFRLHSPINSHTTAL